MTRKTNNRGTANVLADLGFPDAEELTAKAILAKINDILESRGLTQVDAAELLGMPQPALGIPRGRASRDIKKSLYLRCAVRLTLL